MLRLGTQDCHLIAKLLDEVLSGDYAYVMTGRETVRAQALLEDLNDKLNVMIGLDWLDEEVE